MTGLDPMVGTAENYRRFARLEARGRSSAYEALAAGVADDEVVLAFLASLPTEKRQPNLFFAAASYLLWHPPDLSDLHDLLALRREELVALMSRRRTQTNEAARCAVLLPALAALDGPLALLEVGASAGLCLLVERYSYDYAGHRVEGTDPLAPVLACRPSGPVPLRDRLPEVVWRAGLDLNPLKVTDDEDMRWLACLVWPGEGDRSQRLEAAIATARRDPPPIHVGDLLGDLSRLARQAPSGAKLVVYHSAVLAYVDVATRRHFAAAVDDLGAVWLSNEGLGVFPDLRPQAHEGEPFALVRGGTQLLALADPHGTWIEWVGTAARPLRPQRGRGGPTGTGREASPINHAGVR